MSSLMFSDNNKIIIEQIVRKRVVGETLFLRYKSQIYYMLYLYIIYTLIIIIYNKIINL